jgi:hypothetical protein
MPMLREERLVISEPEKVITTQVNNLTKASLATSGLSQPTNQPNSLTH